MSRPWSPPVLRPTRSGAPRAMFGAGLWARPEHAGPRDAAMAFVAAPGPVAVEVGFDHGMVLLDLARARPEVRWLGLELREARVEAVRRHAPPNLLAWRADARAVLPLLPAGRVDLLYVLFPDPVWIEARRARHLLFTPGFVAEVARVLAPNGRLHLRTDVEGYFAWVTSLVAGWAAAPPPELGPTLSRRERVCRRDALPVWSGTWSPR